MAKHNQKRVGLMDTCNVAFETQEGHFVYRVAAIILKNGSLLVAKHQDYPCFYTVGGKVKINETSENAIVRECFEETGIKFSIEKLLYVQERFFENAGQKHHEIVFFYLMKKIDGLDIRENSRSDQGLKETLHWIPLDSIAEYDIVPAFLKTKLSATGIQLEHIVSIE